MTGRKRVALDLRGLSGRDELWRFAAAVKRDRAVESWLNGEPVDLRSIAQKWFARMRGCGDDVRELMHDGCPVACVDDVPFAYVSTFKSHVNVGFWYGAALADPAHLLQGSGKRMRHVKLVPGRESDDAALDDLIEAAYADIKKRIRADSAS
jgi:hypothetical protein